MILYLFFECDGPSVPPKRTSHIRYRQGFFYGVIVSAPSNFVCIRFFHSCGILPVICTHPNDPNCLGRNTQHPPPSYFPSFLRQTFQCAYCFVCQLTLHHRQRLHQIDIHPSAYIPPSILLDPKL